MNSEVIAVESDLISTESDEPGSTVSNGWGNNIPKKDWYDWKWQLTNSIRSIDVLKAKLAERGIVVGGDVVEASKGFPIAITPYYFSLIKVFGPSDPIFMMSFPNCNELIKPSHLSMDPLGEEHDTVVPKLVHRYGDRALLLVTNKCGMNCRYCTRKRVSGSSDFYLTDEELEGAVGYIKSHPEIKDVIISGGDPLTMPTVKLENIIKKVRAIETVDIIRIGTKTPAVLPQRITDELVGMLSRYHPIWVNVHFSHPSEITEESKKAVGKLVNAGIPVNNQNVLLNGVNNKVEILAELYRGLLRIRCRPYYLFSCDLVEGVEHFRTSVVEGIEIMGKLRGRVSGLAIPSFIVDAPDGKGKIPLLPEYVVRVESDKIVLRNFEGIEVSCPNPELV